MNALKELAFHSDAVENFRERGQRLLAAIKPLPRKESPPQFAADRHPAHVLTEKNISSIGPRQTVDSLTMEVSEIAFFTAEGLLALGKEECIDLDKLSEAIQRTSDFKPRVSRKFIRNALLDWPQARLSKEIEQDLPSYILDKARSSIGVFEIWVPLANLAVEKEVQLDPVRVRPISKTILNTWFDSVREGKASDDLVLLEAALEKERQEVQGLAAACIALRAERQFAVDKAIERAEEVAAIFRLFHPANSKPQASFYCRTLGRENVESYSVFVVKEGTFQGRTAHMIPPYPDIWELSDKRLSHLEEDLIPVRSLLAASRRTDFQQEVLDAILLYTRSTMTREPADKLVFIFSALESILLKNEMEPIQTHIADRLAFVLGVSVEERKSIVRLVRTCYGFRSKFLHHGRTLEDFGELAEFMMYVWIFFMRLTKFAHQYGTRPEFLEAIETRKYSGP